MAIRARWRNRQMTDKRLPLTLELPMTFEANVYPSPEGGEGVTVTGEGHWTLVFEPTRDEGIAQVRIEDIEVRLSPSRLPFDLDRDGRPEWLELEGLHLDSGDFDLEASRGEYYFEEGHIALHIVFTLRPEALGPLAEGVEMEPIRFELDERGWLDLETRSFQTHCQFWSVPGGPFAGLTLMGGQGEGTIGPCYATMDLGVWVASKAKLGIPAGQAPSQVWICPRTPIALVWESKSAGTWHVDILPSLGTVLATGSQRFPDPLLPALKPVAKTTVYTAKTSGGKCIAAQDTAMVKVVTPGEIISQTADYWPEFGYWSAELPDCTYDANIQVSEIIIDTVNKNSVTHPKWRVDHIYGGKPTGTEMPLLNDWTPVAAPHPLPGEYRFGPRLAKGAGLPVGEEGRKVFFRLKVACTASENKE
jgi:hypothetical protein